MNGSGAPDAWVCAIGCGVARWKVLRPITALTTPASACGTCATVVLAVNVWPDKRNWPREVWKARWA
jgi:hypothetical protein